MQTTLIVTYDHETDKYIVRNNDTSKTYIVKNENTSKIGIEIEFENFNDVKDFILTTIRFDHLLKKGNKQSKND